MSTISIVDWINSLSDSELEDQLVLAVDGSTPTKGNSGNKASLSEIDLDVTDQGDFNSGTLNIRKFGKSVIITADDLTHDLASFPNTGAGFIPAEFRPKTQCGVVYNISGSEIQSIVIFTDGDFRLQYRDYSGGFSDRESSGSNVACSYNTD